MCKFNLIEAISTSIDPLGPWIEQKQQPPAQSWDFPMLPPILDDFEPGIEPIIDGADSGIPQDLQDLFLDCPPMDAPALPTGDEANHMLDELLSDPASPPLFDCVSPVSPLSIVSETPSCGAAGDITELMSPAMMARDQLVSPPMSLAPDPLLPPQISLDSWPTPSPPLLSDAFSPAPSVDAGGGGVMTSPPWSPVTPVACVTPVTPPAPPAKRRQNRPPRPYDKQHSRRQISDEERRLRKKEQNKTAATRYRQKKKEEQEVNSVDLDALENKNKVLKERVTTLTRELSYLKHLMKEVIKYKRS